MEITKFFEKIVETIQKESENSRMPQLKTPQDLSKDNKFYGTIKTFHDGKNKTIEGTFTVKEINHDTGSLTVEDVVGNSYKTKCKSTSIKHIPKDESETNKNQQDENIEKSIELSVENLETEEKINILINAGLKNLWLVGPAGAGKTTICKQQAEKMEVDFLIISCGIGTSSVEFLGYKYPEREATDFSKYYSRKSIIVLDEFPALDPSVAQVVNAALANGYITTTTGVVHRHPECVIIATSNTFGTGANRQYVANNQLDASTIDRFVGGIIEVNYSKKYESQFNQEVVEYVEDLRYIITSSDIRRIASTRMIIEGTKLKNAGIKEWRDFLIVNWSDSEKKLIKNYLEEKIKLKYGQISSQQKVKSFNESGIMFCSN